MAIAYRDIGHGVSIAFTNWHEHEPVGLIERHFTPEGEEHAGGIMFDLPGVREAFPRDPLWTVEHLDPLTISPSVACRDCGHHGWIRDGAWEPA